MIMRMPTPPAAVPALLTSFLLLLLTACSSGGSSEPPQSDAFQLTAPGAAELALTEGGDALAIPLDLVRAGGHDADVALRVESDTDADAAFLDAGFEPATLNGGTDASTLYLRLAVADAPLLSHSRRYTVVASDGDSEYRLPLDVAITPVDAPDVYLLVGQSNMVGFSGDGTRQSYAGGLDEPHPRILQLNVTPNDGANIFNDAEDFSDPGSIAVSPLIVRAEDPLHVPFDPDNGFKDLEYIGLGLSFAKTALPYTERNIVLVPAAWSGSSFCANDGGPFGGWNAQPTDDPNLGNTLLFDRAVARANAALSETGGILRGILWHQGESDANERCAPSYAANLERLVRELRLAIAADRRGGDLRQPDANIPFVLGSMSRGADERDPDLPNYSESKILIDLAHRNLPSVVAHAALSNHDDLTPANGYPCGNTTCIHFGAEALREMGRRYHEALLRALAD